MLTTLADYMCWLDQHLFQSPSMPLSKAGRTALHRLPCTRLHIWFRVFLSDAFFWGLTLNWRYRASISWQSVVDLYSVNLAKHELSFSEFPSLYNSGLAWLTWPCMRFGMWKWSNGHILLTYSILRRSAQEPRHSCTGEVCVVTICRFSSLVWVSSWAHSSASSC